MRGKVFRHTHTQDRFRITPAYAGKREFKNAAAGMDEDHPRLCGEKVEFLKTEWEQKGSPPPMRGKAPIFPETVLIVRITPAYAGKSASYILNFVLL